MTKYSKLFSFILFSITVLLGLIFYQSQSQGQAVSLEIVTDEGDASELSITNFTGYAFNHESGSHVIPFEFESGEFVFRNERSLLQRLDYQYAPGMNRYVRDYRSFMRGKTRQLSSFVETEEHIYYAALSHDVNWQSSDNNRVSISRFHKETEEETTYEALLTGSSYQNIVAAYVDYPSLTLVTNNGYSGMDNDEWHIYSFNFEEPEDELSPVSNLSRLTDSETIQMGTSHVRTERYIPFRSLEAGETDEYGHIMENHVDTYYVYDTHTNELKDIPAFDDGELIVLSESDRIVVGSDQGEEIIWHEWDFDSETHNELGSTSMSTPSIGRSADDLWWIVFNQNIHLVDGNIYLNEENYMDSGLSKSMLQIISLDTLETVFSGHIDTLTNTEEKIGNSIQNINFNPDYK